jgi:hypothetical protein
MRNFVEVLGSHGGKDVLVCLLDCDVLWTWTKAEDWGIMFPRTVDSQAHSVRTGALWTGNSFVLYSATRLDTAVTCFAVRLPVAVLCEWIIAWQLFPSLNNWAVGTLTATHFHVRSSCEKLTPALHSSARAWACYVTRMRGRWLLSRGATLGRAERKWARRKMYTNF